MNDIKEFMNYVVKQGNSLCVRIPKNISESMKLTETDSVKITIEKLGYEFYNKNYEEMKKRFIKVPEIMKMNLSEEKMLLYYQFILKEGERNHQYHKKALVDKGNKKAGVEEFMKGANEIRKEYHDKIKKEFGEKIYIEFNKFRGLAFKNRTKKK